MSISTKDYFAKLQEWLNYEHYVSVGHAIPTPKGSRVKDWGEVSLVETIPKSRGSKPDVGHQVKLIYRGDAFIVELDRQDPKKGRPALFHFLNSTGSWTKRCDFVVFHLFQRKIHVYCIEFKNNSIDQNHISDQLNRGRDWVASMQAALHFYEKEKRPLHLSRFVFTSNSNPQGFVNGVGFLTSDAKVKLWRYVDAEGVALQNLGGCPEVLR